MEKYVCLAKKMIQTCRLHSNGFYGGYELVVVHGAKGCFVRKQSNWHEDNATNYNQTYQVQTNVGCTESLDLEWKGKSDK
jgi:hypothetical protein